MESSTDQYRLFSDIVELIRELQQQNKHFCVNISNELIPAVYLIGGHRSFLLCVMESLTILSQVLEDIGNSQKKSTIKGDSSSISLRTSSNVVPFPEPCPETSAPIPKAETKGGTFRRHKRNASQDPRTTGANNDNRSHRFSVCSLPRNYNLNLFLNVVALHLFPHFSLSFLFFSLTLFNIPPPFLLLNFQYSIIFCRFIVL